MIKEEYLGLLRHKNIDELVSMIHMLEIENKELKEYINKKEG